MFGYIYITTNKINGKKYIGQKRSNTFLENEYLGSGKILRSAIEKYGAENFEVSLLEEVYGDKKKLDEREMYWISYYNAVSSDNFYNLHPGGVGGATYRHLGHKLTEEQKKADSKRAKQRFIDNPSLRKVASERNKKRFQKQTERDKISKSVKKLWDDPVYRQHMSDVHKGQPGSMKGKHHTDETKRKLSELNKLRGADWYKKHGELIRGRFCWNNGEVNKMSIECPGEGWIKGRLPDNRVWWNDGSKNRKSIECPGEGWIKGRLLLNKAEKDPKTGRFIKGGEKHNEQN